MTNSNGQRNPGGVSRPELGVQRRRRRSASPDARQSAYEWTVLGLALLAPVVGPWLFGGVRLWSTGSLLFVTFVDGVLFGLRPLLFRATGHPVFPASLPFFGIFLVYAAVRIPVAASPYDAALDVCRCAGLLTAFWIWVDFTGGHHNRWRWLVNLLLLSASTMSLYALVQHNQGSNIVLTLPRPEQYGMRASGAFMCPNHFASFIGMVLPLAVALIFCRDAGYVVRLFALYAVAVIPPAVYLTQSRSGWLGVLLGLVVTTVLLAARRSWRSFWAACALAPLVAAGIAAGAWTFSPMVRSRIEDALQGNPRIQLWKDTAQMIRAAPVWGHGPGSFRWVYPAFWHEMKSYLDPEHAHNEALEVVADHGAAGTALLAAGLLTAAGTLLLRLRAATRDRDASLIAGATGAAAAVCAHGLFDYNLHVFGVASAFVMIGGMATSALFSSGAIGRREWCGARFRRAAGLVAAAVCVLLAVVIARAVGSHLFTRGADAARAALLYEKSERAYRRAIAWDRRNPQAWLGYAHLLRIRGTWNQDEAAKKADLARAGALYHEALARNPALLDAEVSLAILYNQTGDAERALAMLQRAVAHAPLHRDNLCRLGLQLKQMGRRAEALEMFRRARELGSTIMIELNLRDLEQDAAPGPAR